MSDETIQQAVRRVDESDVAVETLTGEERRLDGRVRVVWALRSATGALIFAFVATVAGFLLRQVFWPGPVAFAVVFALGVAFAVARYRTWRYRVREDSLFLDRGVLTKVRTVVPYVRIQHVDSRRGPIERTFGLASVVVYTAGSRGADVTIPGLTPERAEDLQTRLKQLAIAAEGEDAV